MTTQYGIRFKQVTVNGIATCTQTINGLGWTISKEEAERVLSEKHSWRNQTTDLSAWIVERQLEARPSFKEAMAARF
jgi:hypothetical protein